MERNERKPKRGGGGYSVTLRGGPLPSLVPRSSPLVPRSMAKLYFYYSAMNAGKTTTLLQSAHNYRERGMRVALLTPRLDHRAGSGVVASRIGLQAQATSFDAGTDLPTSGSSLSSRLASVCGSMWARKP